MKKQMLKLVSLSLLTFCLSTPVLASDSSPTAAGTETGHGGGGDNFLGHPKFERSSPREWCSHFNPMVEDVIDDVRDANSLAEKHAALLAGIKSILNAYQSGQMPYQPLTYLLLVTAVKLDRNFPTPDAKGDQTAGIVLSKMLSVAQHVNSEFDLPRFIPAMESYGRCHHFRCRDSGLERDTDELADEFYINYLAAARSVVDMLFEPAVSNSSANVLQAMAYDRWQLNASLDILNYILGSLHMDILSRRLGCLETRVQYIIVRLESYLASTPVSPIQDMEKRMKVEHQLDQIRSELDGVRSHGGRWACEYHR